MVTFAKLVLIIVGLFLTFFIKVKSSLIFGLSLVTILAVGIFVMTGHSGVALEFSAASFIIMIMALFRYLVEINVDEK